MSKIRASAIIPAAGKGERLKSAVPKPLVLVHGRPIFIWTLLTISRSYPFQKIVIPTDKKYMKVMQKWLRRYKLKNVSLIEGGKTRAESVKNGMDELDGKTNVILVHDAARPLLKRELVKRLIREANGHGACILAHKATSTVKEVNPSRGTIKRTIDRKKIFMAQTPQVVQAQLLSRAYSKHKKKAFRYTDEASLVESIGRKVRVLEGPSSNIKVTTPEDLLVAKSLLKGRKG